MGIIIGILTGLILSIHGGSIGRNLWRADSRIGMAWRSEHDYIMSMRLLGMFVITMAVIGGWKG
jgi:hypothetical protein